MNQPAAPAGTVSSYTLRTSAGRRIRTATMVVFDDGSEVRFLELMPAREALAHAETQRVRDQRAGVVARIADELAGAGVFVELTPMRRVMVAAGDLLRSDPRLARALERAAREA